MRQVLVTAVLSALGLCHAAIAADDILFNGVCDASAGWPMDDDQKLIAVGEDEHDVLLVYATTGGDAQNGVDVDPALHQERPKKEADFEAVAGLGGRLYNHGTRSKRRWRGKAGPPPHPSDFASCGCYEGCSSGEARSGCRLRDCQR